MIARDPSAAASSSFDLAIVGGGIYGAALALEAARRGLRPVLVERGDFGGATSWNSLRIVHGGLRYLQTLDLPRFRESVAERRWFLRSFPTLVRPLACLMPLYARGLKRPSVFRGAMLANDLLSWRRNVGLDHGSRIPGGGVLGPRDVRARFPQVDPKGLRGGALWYDASMPDSQRVLIEMLRWACARGALALNHVEAVSLLVAGGRAVGIACRDLVRGGTFEVKAPLVVNCAGPWSRRFAAQAGQDDPALFRPSLAFNVLLDRPPLAAEALAVQPRRSGAPIYFLHPWKGKVLAGTVHAPWSGEVDVEAIPADLVASYLADLADAVPGWGVGPADVLRVHWGFLPAREEATALLAVRPEVRDHGADGGPAGFWSLSGVKFTTARLVAERLLVRLPREAGQAPVDPPPSPAEVPDRGTFEALLARDPAGAVALVRRIVREEAVVRPEDLLLRRTDWGSDPRDEARLAPQVAPLLDPAP